MRHLKKIIIPFMLVKINLTYAQPTEKKETAPSSTTSSEEAESVNVDSIKEKYWARGSQVELGVVQNRTYLKKGRIELSLLGGIIYSDPFLNIKTFGFSLGYHLSEYFSLHLIALKDSVGSSSALDTFQETLGATVNTNFPQSYFGAEGMSSIFYGKLSVLGKSIIYYDFYFLSGLGVTNTESGKDITPSLGLGQRFYLNKTLSVRLDYRLMYYRETILEKEIPTLIGQVDGTRNNWNNTVLLAVSFMLF